MDGFNIGPASIIFDTLGALLFLFLGAFTIFNTVKFYRHRSYSLGIFYMFTILNCLLRASYFTLDFFYETKYIKAILLVSPGAISLSISMAQIMNYVILYIRLDSYASHRAIKGDEITEDELRKT